MGTLFIVSTPIGNLEDITIRALRVLSSCTDIICEDTRRAGSLIQELSKRYPDYFNHAAEKRYIRYDNQTENTVTPEIMELLKAGSDIALISDAGTPLIADPGYRIVHETVKRDIPVQIIPGPTAFVAAVTRSGLPANQIFFLGFLPEQVGKRKTILQSLGIVSESKEIRPTFVCYVAPHKLHQTLSDMKEIYGDIEVCIARELTKVHEEYWYGTMNDALSHFTNPRGEFVLMWPINKQ